VRDEPRSPLSVRVFLRSFYLEPKLYRSFYWVLLTRLFEQMGVYTVLPYFQYFIQDVIFGKEPEDSTKHELFSSLLLGSIVLASIPASITAGILSDKYGRKRMVIISMSIMSAAVAYLISLCYYQSMPALFGGGVVFGIGYGAFLAVDWALALDSLPEGADIAKDMGIWHISFVLPQVVAPIISGQILSHLKTTSYELAYTVVFAVSCMWFILATVFVLPIQLKPKVVEPENEWTNRKHIVD